MSHQTLKMSLGFIAVVALALGAALPAWADITWNGVNVGTSYTVSATGNVNGIDLGTGTNTVTQNAYTVTVNNGYLRTTADTGTSTYNLSGGSLAVTGNTIYFDRNSTAVLNVSGTGSLSATQGFILGKSGGGGSATLNISGSATVSLVAITMGPGNSYMTVTGGGATINLTGTSFDTGSGALGGLVFTLDNSTKHISTIVSTGWIALDHSPGKIDIATSGFTPTIGNTFDLMQSTDTIWLPSGGANNLLNAGDKTDWSLALVTESSKNILRLTALTPEPATMALLAIGGLGMLIRRRKS